MASNLYSTREIVASITSDLPRGINQRLSEELTRLKKNNPAMQNEIRSICSRYSTEEPQEEKPKTTTFQLRTHSQQALIDRVVARKRAPLLGRTESQDLAITDVGLKAMMPEEGKIKIGEKTFDIDMKKLERLANPKESTHLSIAMGNLVDPKRTIER